MEAENGKVSFQPEERNISCENRKQEVLRVLVYFDLVER